MLQQAFVQGTQEPGRPSNPVGQRGAVKLNALPSIDLGLAIERQMVRVLPDDNVGDQGLGRQTALDQPRRCWCLHHSARTGSAGILGTAHDQDPELSRDHVQPLGHVLTDGMQPR